MQYVTQLFAEKVTCFTPRYITFSLLYKMHRHKLTIYTLQSHTPTQLPTLMKYLHMHKINETQSKHQV